MKILIDSREQKKLEFIGIETVVKKLDFCDYSCQLNDYFIVPIYFERKTQSDLMGTLTQGYSRFKDEIIRCQEAKCKMIIIIEATLTKVSKGIKHSTRSGDSVLSQLMTIFVKYGIIPVFCKDAAESAKYITMFYKAYEKNYIIKKNQAQCS